MFVLSTKNMIMMISYDCATNSTVIFRASHEASSRKIQEEAVKSVCDNKIQEEAVKSVCNDEYLVTVASLQGRFQLFLLPGNVNV